MHLVFENLIEVFIHVVVLEWRPHLLVSLVYLIPLFPLYDLRNLTPPKFFISVLGVILFSGNKFVSHGHSLHQLLHNFHHQFKIVIQGLRCLWFHVSLGFLIAYIESLFDLP